MPIATKPIAPRTPPTTSPTSVALPLPLLSVVSGLAALSLDLERALARLSDDREDASAIERSDSTDATERTLIRV